jgi:hypothetical protein
MPVSRRASSQRPREQPGKRRHDEDPAQHADLRQTAADGHVTLTQPLSRRSRRRRFPTISGSSSVGWNFGLHRNSPASAPGRSRLIMRRMAFNCRRTVSTCSLRSSSASAGTGPAPRRPAWQACPPPPPRAWRCEQQWWMRSAVHGQHPAAHGAEPFGFGLAPTDDRDRERRQKRGVAGPNAEAAAGVLGAQAVGILVHNDGQRGHDPQSHRRGLGCRLASAAFGRRLFLARVLQRADHVERAFRPVVGLAVENGAAAREGLGQRHAGARHAGKGLGHHEGLCQEPLQPPRALDDQPVGGPSSSTPSSEMMSVSSRNRASA